MEKWEQVARNFIDSCDFKDDIEAVFLTGSHAVGNADEFSDIDLYIVLSDEVKYRERGNKRIDGLLVEYFANPKRQVKKYIDDGYPHVQLTEINMILSGIVIFNKNSTADKVIDYCKQKRLCAFSEMDDFNVKTGLYHLWDGYDELGRAYAAQSSDFAMQYFRFVQNAFELYSRYICSPVPNYRQLYRWLTDEAYFNNFGLEAHKDQDFVDLTKLSFQHKDAAAMFELSKVLYEYVVDKMGGFDIDNFVLHGLCN